MEHTRKIVISCIEHWVKYTGRNLSKKYGRTYLLSSSYEINLLENSMQTVLKKDMNNEGKWKEARYQQVKQWLIMINVFPEDK